MRNWRDLKHLGPVRVPQRIDAEQVLRDLPAGRAPRARLRYVDGDDLFVNWIWDHQPDSPRMTVIERRLVAPALEALALAVPTPLPGESGEQALVRALSKGPLMDLEREQRLAETLTAALVPAWLGAELNVLEAAGLRPHLRVQLSPSTSHLPWELLSTSDGERGIDMVDVSVLLPATLRNDPARRVAPPWRPGAPVAAVLDPVVPGFPAHSDLGSVLGPVAPDAPLAAMVRRLGDRVRPAGDAFRRADIDRAALADAAADAGRLLYVGHVTASTHALDARMHLSDGLGSPGLAQPLGPHRPYTAADIALGAPGLDPLDAPNRVALIACDSGGDARFAEPTGLTAAFVHRGAEYVTATRWTLPTEAGLARFGTDLRGDAEGMLSEAVIAVDAAHEASDPVAALGAWQREQRRRWTATGDPRFSPVIWGALATAWAPAAPR
ncbi:CHAT domain-containing protein [Microbacterium sp. CIAB417]|uniref:CHAT domain-containing protein n=1 Tax=Microbacterium sp. CIAB417 TaxID=2860287 RepID=UPI001FACFD24|nr:CHAT domain-containing protein [Microbacterium sp. CIAB417]